ncbi:lipopolysaccharide assembly protein LapB [Solimonas sp. SE-A11]|uniref:tetratricopeptide repeat protein n=1 Tax=Solimonas sp. SE-A11 TaxID=3054954 RepID=UPI00259CEA3A|nr:tetratricopeptide repeat protein [Solimonas sp. SE-A11]MDM4772898.1 tetratricopeptide repeat protein [Solimonas sp. SE-A11]
MQNVFDGEELLVLARMDLEKGVVEQGLAKLKQAAALGDCPPAVRLELARVYAQLGLRGKARAQFEAYLQTQPGDIDASFQLGMTRFEDGDTDAALAIWERVLQQSAQYPPALYFRAVAAARRGQGSEARAQLRSALDVIPADNLYFTRSRDLLASMNAAERSGKAEPVALNAADAYRTQH